MPKIFQKDGLGQKNVTMCFFGLFFASGLLALLIGIVFLCMSFPSAYWPSVSGQVVSSKVTQVSSGSSPRGHRLYRLDIQYDYVVAGEEYRGKRLNVISFGQHKKAVAQKLLEPFPTGATVNVHYYPKDPQKSVLIPGVPSDLYIVFYAGFGLTVFGLVGIGFVSGWFRRSSR